MVCYSLKKFVLFQIRWKNNPFLSLRNCDWLVIKRNYLVEYKIANGSCANNSKNKHLLNIKGIVKHLCSKFKALKVLIHICMLLLDVLTQQRQRSQQQPVPTARSSSQSVSFCVPAVKTISRTVLRLWVATLFSAVWEWTQSFSFLLKISSSEHLWFASRYNLGGFCGLVCLGFFPSSY